MFVTPSKWAVALCSAVALACSDSDKSSGAGESASLMDGGASALDAQAGELPPNPAIEAGMLPREASVFIFDGATMGGPTCATTSAGVELQPVHLSFALDVSGSMGNGESPKDDKTLKWDPVVSAMKSFFGADASTGLSASLTFFPGADDAARCEPESYVRPDVPLTALPSPEFAAAIERVTPTTPEAWRKGTPTAPALRGLAMAAAAAQPSSPNARRVLVLVTDGYPGGCGTTLDRIDAVVGEATRARDAGLSTFVVGIGSPGDPPGAPPIAGLHRIADAGATSSAFMIDVADASATVHAFTAAIARIRSASLDCSIAIPAPPEGVTFDKSKVAVRTMGARGALNLAYDQACSRPDAWHYDDPLAPKSVVLCDATCSALQADREAKLAIDFACEQLIVF